MSKEPFWAKVLFLALFLPLMAWYFHSDSTGYRDQCRSAIRNQEPDYEVVYACRWTTHPEKDHWWGDWTLGDYAQDMDYPTARKLKELVR